MVASQTDFPNQYYELIEKMKKESVSSIAIVESITSGRSGAFVAKIHAEFKNQFLSKFQKEKRPRGPYFIMKIDSYARSEIEITAHKKIIASNNEFLKKHIPRLVTYPYGKSNRNVKNIALIYEIAGYNLNDFRAVSKLDDNSKDLKTAFKYISVFLNEVNDVTMRAVSDKMSPITLFCEWLNSGKIGWNPEHIKQFLNSVVDHKNSDELLDDPFFVFNGTYLIDLFPNPVYYVLKKDAFGDHKTQISKGFTHGDLNQHNIHVQIQNNKKSNGYLIDLSHSSLNSPLLFDNAYFELSYLINSHLIESGTPLSINEIIILCAKINEDERYKDRQISALVKTSYDILNAGRKKFQEIVRDRYPSAMEELKNQWLLASIAAGLNFCNKKSLDNDDANREKRMRMFAFLWASINLNMYLYKQQIPLINHNNKSSSFTLKPLFNSREKRSLLMLEKNTESNLESAISNDAPKPAFDELQGVLTNSNALWEQNKSKPLFMILLKDKMNDVKKTIKLHSFSCNDAEVEQKGVLLAQNVSDNAFLTYLVGFQNEWGRFTTYLKETRIAAARIKNITRVYICDKSRLRDTDLLVHMREDELSGIKAYVVLGEDVPSKDVDILRDFGIWDDEVLCLVDRGREGENLGCEYMTDDSELITAQGWRKKLMSYAKTPLDILSTEYKPSKEETDIMEYAPQMEKLSKKCDSVFLGPPECSWYHKSWQYLRLLGMVANPDWHRNFYNDELMYIFQQNSNTEFKILICGLADYGMLSQVLHSLKAAQMDAKITILDSCETPLSICKQYAEDHGFNNITTITSNITKAKLNSSEFDLVITDEFLTVIPPSSKVAVIEVWKKILKPGGYLITTVMLAANRKSSYDNTAQKIKQYVDETWKRAGERAVLVWSKLAENEIKELARDYATKMKNYTLQNGKQVEELLSGFILLNNKIKKCKTDGEFIHPTYSLEILARKPNSKTPVSKTPNKN